VCEFSALKVEGQDYGCTMQWASTCNQAGGCILCQHWADIFACFTHIVIFVVVIVITLLSNCFIYLAKM